MASTTNKTSATKQSAERTNSDSLRWTFGLLLLFVGLFALASVIFYYFNWQADYDVINHLDTQNPHFDTTIDNPCGWLGAWLGEQIVGRSFGLFGILLPFIVAMLGVRIIRQRPMMFNHSVLNLLLILILGSLTLGFAFDTSWGVFGSGWGGAFGIAIAQQLSMAIGQVGTIILLVGGWILTGVFINRNFINTVNSAGNAVVDKSERIVDMVKQSVIPSTVSDKQEQSADPTAVKTPSQSAVEPKSATDAPIHGSVSSTPNVDLDIKRPADEFATPVVAKCTQPKRVVLDDEHPFAEISADGEIVEAQQPSNAITPAWRDIVRSDDEFTVFDIADTTPNSAANEVADEDVAGANNSVCADMKSVASEFDEVDADDISPEEDDAEGGVVVTVEANKAKVVDESQITTESYDPLKDLNNYQRPPVSLLEDYMSDTEVSDEEIYENKSKIEETLKNFGIPIQRIKATVGPTVTLYEIVQAQGVKIAKIQSLENDIAQSLKAFGIRIIAPIPGKGTIGIEVPNRDKQIVSMYSAVRSMRFQEMKAELPVVIGRTIQNENFVFDLAKMPHLLVAGATGQGKSVGLNAIITSLLYRKHPAQLKFVMIDPKMVEFSLYAKIEKHFLAKMESEDEAIVTDPKKAVYTLNALCTEMDARLELCKKAGARNIAEYNAKFTARRLNPNKGHRYMPYIVVVVDEFADLIMTAREVEGPVMRLAQKARAIGIHLIIATQRPDVKVITGGIKANFPARIAFRVMQMIDSRTIIDQPGANTLIGRGDMLLSKDGELTRIQCALVETKEVERIVDYIAQQQGYSTAYNLPDYVPESSGEQQGMGSESGAPVKYDTLFADIARAAVSGGQISTSSIQRNYEVGFNRAGRIMMQLERAGIVGRQEGAKPRDILYHDMPSLEAKLQDLGLF